VSAIAYNEVDGVDDGTGTVRRAAREAKAPAAEACRTGVKTNQRQHYHLVQYLKLNVLIMSHNKKPPNVF
jgi:hypothetical protein